MQVVAVAVDPPADLERMRSAAGAQMLFLSDAEGRLMDLFGVRHAGMRGPTGDEIAQSASFLLDADGTLVWQKIAESYRVRPHPDEILAAIDRELTG